MDSKRMKILVDISMVIFIILSFVRWDGMGGAIYHFVVGTGCALFFGLHVFIHRKWIKATTKSCFAGTLNKTLRGKYVVNVLLLSVWGISIVTGFMALGPFLSHMEGVSIIGRLHGITARIGLILVVIHAVQHLPQIKSYLGIKKQVSGV